MPKITINDLTYLYIDKKKNTGVAAICNLNAVIENNSFSVIIGESGCGKTTLLKLLTVLLKPHEGSIYFDNNDITKLDANERNLSYISQEFALYPHLTVFDNIAYPLKISKVPSEEIRLRVNEMLKMLDLVPYQTRKPRHLSIGQRQRVALGRALVKRPSLILLDEPFSNLDEPLKKELIDLIKEIKNKLPITFIYVTHRLDEIKFVGTNVLVLHNGTIVQNDTMDKVLTDKDGFYSKNISKYY